MILTVIYLCLFYIATLPGEKVQFKRYLQCVNYINPIYIYIYIFFLVITALTQPAPFVQDIHNIIFYYLVKHTADHKSILANIKNNATFQNA